MAAEPLVGRTGAEGACVLVDSSPRHEAPVAHVRPFWQQPPPRLAAHENQPVEQVYADVEDDDTGAALDVIDGEVGTTIMAAEDVLAGAVDVEGCTVTTLVPW